jgi:hypothetical protein
MIRVTPSREHIDSSRDATGFLFGRCDPEGLFQPLLDLDNLRS